MGAMVGEALEKNITINNLSVYLIFIFLARAESYYPVTFQCTEWIVVSLEILFIEIHFHDFLTVPILCSAMFFY